MSVGNLIFYGGIMGIIISILTTVICLKKFPKQREYLLKTLGDE